METSYTTYHEEQEFNDLIFPTLGMRHDNRIQEDEHYKSPNIKTWVYSNVEDFNAWVDVDGFPVRTEFNESLFKLSGPSKGVFIIRSYTIQKDNIQHLEELLVGLYKSQGLYNREVLEAITNKIKEATLGIRYLPSITIRLVDFISMTELLEKKYVYTKRFKIGLTVEQLFNKAEEVNGPKDCTTIWLSYATNNGEELICKVGNEIIKVPPVPSGNENIGLTLTTIDNNGNCTDTFIPENFLDKHGLITSKDYEAGIDVFTRYKDLHKTKMEVRLAEIKMIQDMKKLMIDNSTSIHKLLYQINKTEASLTTKDKEEVSLIKEGLKALVSFV